MDENLPEIGDYFGLEKRDLLSVISGPDFTEHMSKLEVLLNSDDPNDSLNLENESHNPNEDTESIENEVLGCIYDMMSIDFDLQPVNISGLCWKYSYDEDTDKDIFDNPDIRKIENNGQLAGLIVMKNIPMNSVLESDNKSYIYN